MEKINKNDTTFIYKIIFRNYSWGVVVLKYFFGPTK